MKPETGGGGGLDVGVDEPQPTSVQTDIKLEHLRKIAEGKTKEIYELRNDSTLVLIRSKDNITAFDGARAHELEGKSSLSNFTTCKVFEYLKACGLRTHFVQKYSESEFIAERCAMIPLEMVARRIATGSFLKRNPGVREGFRFTPPKIEIFFKDDANGDPQWSEEMVYESGMTVGGIAIGRRHMEYMRRVTRLVLELLEFAWSRERCTLVDMKLEFGINPEGDIVLADVIDNDSWRLWPEGDRRLQVDKQFYRDLQNVTQEDLSTLKKNFQWVNDKMQNFIKPPVGRCVVIMGSASDTAVGERVRATCHALGVPTELRVASAHKGTDAALAVVDEYTDPSQPTVFVAVAGRSNGLGPVIAGNTVFPVINCPPGGQTAYAPLDVWSSLRLPSGLHCTTLLDAECTGLAVASYFAMFDHMVYGRMRTRQLENWLKLDRADNRMEQENDRAMEQLRRALSLCDPAGVSGMTNGECAAATEGEPQGAEPGVDPAAEQGTRQPSGVADMDLHPSM